MRSKYCADEGWNTVASYNIHLLCNCEEGWMECSTYSLWCNLREDEKWNTCSCADKIKAVTTFICSEGKYCVDEEHYTLSIICWQLFVDERWNTVHYPFVTLCRQGVKTQHSFILLGNMQVKWKLWRWEMEYSTLLIWYTAWANELELAQMRSETVQLFIYSTSGVHEYSEAALKSIKQVCCWIYQCTKFLVWKAW